MDARVIMKMSYDSPPKPYWIIEETVTPQDHTIEWPGIYATEKRAQEVINEGW